MDVNKRIKYLMDERCWSEYRLAKESGLSQSTIANIYRRNTTPSIPTLESICKGFGITLSQFFMAGTVVELSNEQKDLFSIWIALTAEQKKIIFDLINALKSK